MKYKFIQKHKELFPVEKMCQALEVSRSGYYRWLTKAPSKRKKENEILLKTIKEIHKAHHEKYGSPRITPELRASGYLVGENRVARLMKENQIKVKKRKKWVQTTDSEHPYPIAPNLLNRDFKASEPNRVWVSDITYIATTQGWVYLCIILDLYSRKVVGWNLRSDMTTALVKGAFEMAWVNRKPSKGLIFHSDRGVQYASHEFRGELRDKGCLQSMSRKGNCWDNAPAEAFFARLKEERCDYVFRGYHEARMVMFEYIEVYYNRQRRHSSLGYLCPHDFELRKIA